jgi:chemotaxis protein MotA
MDIATGLGLLAGATVVCTLMLMGGDLRMFLSDHAVIIIFGGSFAATLIRFPLTAIFHGLPLGAKYAFTMRRATQRELVDEVAALAEIARKQGPLGLEKVEIEDAFLAKGIRFVADGYEADFIRDNLERDRDNFLTHLDEGQKIYRAIGDCAPRRSLARSWRPRCSRRFMVRLLRTSSACRLPTSCISSWLTKRSTGH